MRHDYECQKTHNRARGETGIMAKIQKRVDGEICPLVDDCKHEVNYSNTSG